MQYPSVADKKTRAGFSGILRSADAVSTAFMPRTDVSRKTISKNFFRFSTSCRNT